MIIRKATKADYIELLKLLEAFYVGFNRGQLFPEKFSKFEAYKNMNEVLKQTTSNYLNDNKYIVFVADNGENLDGYICGVIKEKEHKIFDKEGCIEDWFVKESVRKKGVGSVLYKALVKEFRLHKCTHLAIESYAFNVSALAFYRKLGFIDKSMRLIKNID